MKFFNKKPSPEAVMIQELKLQLRYAERNIGSLQNQLQSVQETLTVEKQSTERFKAINLDLQNKIQEQDTETYIFLAKAEQDSRQTSAELKSKDMVNHKLQRETRKLEKCTQKQNKKVLKLQEDRAALRKDLRKTNESSQHSIVQLEHELHDERQRSFSLQQEVTALRLEKDAVIHILTQTQTEMHTVKKDLELSLSEAFNMSVEEEVRKITEHHKEEIKAIDVMMNKLERAIEKSCQMYAEEVNAKKNAEDNLEKLQKQMELRMDELRAQMIHETEKNVQENAGLQTELSRTRKELVEQKQRHQEEMQTLKEAGKKSVEEAKTEMEKEVSQAKKEADDLERRLQKELHSVKTAVERSDEAKMNAEKKLENLEIEIEKKNVANEQLERKVKESGVQKVNLQKEIQVTKKALEKLKAEKEREAMPQYMRSSMVILN